MSSTCDSNIEEILKLSAYKVSEQTSVCDGVLFVERSSELILSARLSQMMEPQWKRGWIARLVGRIRPETGWPNHEQVEAAVTGSGGPNRGTQ